MPTFDKVCFETCGRELRSLNVSFVRIGSLIGLSLGEEEGDDVVSIDGRG